VARVRLLYPPPTMELFLVIAHTFFISSCYHRIYMTATNAIFYIAILIMSVVIHEVSHGFMAEYFGDPTARNAGRLTLNPISHLDWFGSVLLPAVLVLAHSPFLFGWAKPVPYNPNNLTTNAFAITGLYYWRYFRRFTPGVVVTSLAFLAWGLVFPVAGGDEPRTVRVGTLCELGN